MTHHGWSPPEYSDELTRKYSELFNLVDTSGPVLVLYAQRKCAGCVHAVRPMVHKELWWSPTYMAAYCEWHVTALARHHITFLWNEYKLLSTLKNLNPEMFNEVYGNSNPLRLLLR